MNSSLALVLASGGDLRIWPDPQTGRTKYGTLARPAPGEISFASTTASSISEAAFAAAGAAHEALFSSSIGIDAWFAEVRGAIAAELGIPGSEAILAASGTDAEVVTLSLVAGLARRPITNIFIAPDETGHGVPLAAAGRHFASLTALGAAVAPGAPIAGLSPEQIEVRAIAIRDAQGAPRAAAAIDLDVASAVEQELRRGRDILLHVLDVSKTGLSGLTRETALSLAKAASGRVRVVVDACQLRLSPSEVKRDLAAGFMVTVTGSKFAGGPPFCGALLIPPSLVEELASGVVLPPGLADYSAALDWPEALRGRVEAWVRSEANIGLGLRWVAALESIAPLARLAEDQRVGILDRFAEAVRTRAGAIAGIALHSDDAAARTIIPLTVLDPDGTFASLDRAKEVQLALRSESRGPVCHIGQPVRLGSRSVLRVAASAQDVLGIAARLSGGASYEEAFAPVTADLDVMLEKLAGVCPRLGRVE